MGQDTPTPSDTSLDPLPCGGVSLCSILQIKLFALALAFLGRSIFNTGVMGHGTPVSSLVSIPQVPVLYATGWGFAFTSPQGTAVLIKPHDKDSHAAEGGLSLWLS